MIRAAYAESSKIPEVTLIFWVIKVLATTLGETGGDMVSMTFNLGYLVSTGIFLALFVAMLVAQLRSRQFRPFLYWSVIVATTLVGTTTADFFDRSLGIGYAGGSTVLFTLVILCLGAWRLMAGSVSVAVVNTPKVELFYWITILCSNTLGTALGDLVSNDSGFGYGGSAVAFAGALALVAAAYFVTRWSHTFLFWAAFVLTRPLGATIGDSLTKPLAHGGLDLSRVNSSSLITIFIVVCVLVLPQRAGHHPRRRAIE
jgi:uncharacterized membrane-anchored protein